MARGKRPVSFRTRKLSLSAPMVLPWRRGGRVGRRRTTPPKGPQPPGWGPFAYPPTRASFAHRRFVAMKHASAAAGLLGGGADVVGQPRVECLHLPPDGPDLVQRRAIVQPVRRLPVPRGVQRLVLEQLHPWRVGRITGRHSRQPVAGDGETAGDEAL